VRDDTDAPVRNRFAETRKLPRNSARSLVAAVLGNPVLLTYATFASAEWAAFRLAERAGK
jgi:hypothetical protein